MSDDDWEVEPDSSSWDVVHLWLDDERRKVVMVSLARLGTLLLVNPPPSPPQELQDRISAAAAKWRRMTLDDPSPLFTELRVLRVVMELGERGPWSRVNQPHVLSVAARSHDCLKGLLGVLAVLGADDTAVLHEHPSGRHWEERLPRPDPSVIARIVRSWVDPVKDEGLEWLLMRAFEQDPNLRAVGLESRNAMVRALFVNPDDPLELLGPEVIIELDTPARRQIAERDDLDVARISHLVKDADDSVRHLVLRRLAVSAGSSSDIATSSERSFALSEDDRLALLSQAGTEGKLVIVADLSIPFQVVTQVLGELDPMLTRALLERPDRSPEFVAQQVKHLEGTDRVLRHLLLADPLLPGRAARQWLLSSEDPDDLFVLAGRQDLDALTVEGRIRDVYRAGTPAVQLPMLSRPAMPLDVLNDVVLGDSDPALVCKAISNPACPQNLVVAALRDADVTVRLKAVQTLRDRDLPAPVESLLCAMRLPLKTRPSRLHKVLEFSPGLIRSAARRLMARPAERAEADARLVDIHESLSTDLLYAMSRSAQELFHSNTWAWLATRSPDASRSLLRLFGSDLEPDGTARIWREHQHLDLLMDPGGTHPKVVIENKLFSVPGPEQLIRYTSTPLPWSGSHGEEGASNTRYVLLSLLPPSFAVPAPWSHLGYDGLVGVIDDISAHSSEADASLIARYARLVRGLSDLAEAVDPRFRPDEHFFSWQPRGLDLMQGELGGIVQKLRYSGLVQMLPGRMGPDQPDLEVNITRGVGLASCFQQVSTTRSVGWQLQGDQFRVVVRMQDQGLHGKGPGLKEARSREAAEDHADWFDFAPAEEILGDLLRPRKPEARTWLHFDPDFVYQVRKLDRAVRTDQLVRLLTTYTVRALNAT